MAGEVGLKQGALPITQSVSAAFGGGGGLDHDTWHAQS